MSRRLLVFSLVVLCSVPLALVSAPKAAAPVDLNLTDLSGKKVRLRDLRGKPVVLNFWATWCGPCKDEMPLFVDAQKRFAAKGVTFIAASLDDDVTQKNIPAFVQRFHLAFPVWTGVMGEDLERLGMGEELPGTVFIDPAGVVFSRVQGEIKRAELEERLVWITGDKSKPAPKALVRNVQ